MSSVKDRHTARKAPRQDSRHESRVSNKQPRHPYKRPMQQRSSAASSGANRLKWSQMRETYLTRARASAQAGDTIAAENYYQHAEHYYRMLQDDAR